jgi:hypothetical protein
MYEATLIQNNLKAREFLRVEQENSHHSPLLSSSLNMYLSFSNIVALSAVILASNTAAAPLTNDMSPVSVLQKRAHGTCAGDPRCKTWMGANFKDHIKNVFRDGVNYDHRMLFFPIMIFGRKKVND